MAWFKVDDQLHGHPKARRAGLEAMGLWSLAGSQSIAYKLNGFVPQWYIDSWPKGKRLAAQLVSADLWEPAQQDGLDGFMFHDWSHFQPSADEIERDRENSRIRQRNRRERMRSGGQQNQDQQAEQTRGGIRAV